MKQLMSFSKYSQIMTVYEFLKYSHYDSLLVFMLFESVAYIFLHLLALNLYTVSLSELDFDLNLRLPQTICFVLPKDVSDMTIIICNLYN